MAAILIIDDEAQMRRLLERTLQAAGHETIAATHGGTGLMLFRARRADLVITDLFMPEQEGIETILALKREAPEVPILAISGGAAGGMQFLDMAEKLGAAATLQKPFGVADLLQTVARLLARQGPHARRPRQRVV